MTSVCEVPRNGGRHCGRDEDFARNEETHHDLRQAQTGLETAVHRFETRVTEGFIEVLGSVHRIEAKVDRLAGIVDEQPTHAGSALAWDAGEVTRSQSPDELIARAKREERARVGLESQVAALEARLLERDRHSERVHSDAQARAERKTRIVIAVATSGTGLALLGALAKWLLP